MTIYNTMHGDGSNMHLITSLTQCQSHNVKSTMGAAHLFSRGANSFLRVSLGVGKKLGGYVVPGYEPSRASEPQSDTTLSISSN